MSTPTKKRILFINPYPHDKAPSQRLKYEQYYPHMRAAGYEIEYSSFYDDEIWKVLYKPGHIFAKAAGFARGYARRIKDLFRLRHYDIVYIHLWVTPIRPAFFEWLYGRVAKRIIYDIDDLVFLKEAKHIAWWRGMLKSRKKPVHLMKKARHVITCTPFLDEFTRQYNQNTTDISSTIDTDAYQPVNNYQNDHRLVLGWSGSHSTVTYLKLYSDMLQELAKTHDFKLLVMGSADFSIEGVDYEAVAWTAEREIPTLQRFDIGLYPLPLDDQWVMGKSGLKALQYMSLGIPTVATGIGANYRVIEDGVSGYLVKSKEEWIEKLKLLLDNPEKRRRIGSAAHDRVEALYSIKTNAPVYLQILDRVVHEA
ncbi:glycosyltransferase family 4 protein [Flaviaesturariibacter aridisoli]|uniref:Glycosyltransferase n=1 Tax=Flaviaesturariibacter aridisoli TaxID=2545761 RepID=A0A4R4E172_9BACT|nr:glycosyltransferase family 4 protein [Flaviaesturariibacter aridisoli]TCZ73136.1 glycosyltransferase [Flaviaesturariibacter aridisoli]